MKYVLLTGASGGLGTHLSEYLLRKGYYVIMLYNNHKEEVEKIRNKFDNSMIYKIDLTSDDEINDLIDFLRVNELSIDILINNAAIDHMSDIYEKNKDTFFKTYELNTYVPFKLMRDLPYKTCVNISSENAIDTYDPVTIEYDLSKVSLNMLSNIFRAIYPERIINTICFGWLDTPMNKIDDDIKKLIEFVPFDKACSEIEKLFDENKDLVIIRK